MNNILTKLRFKAISYRAVITIFFYKLLGMHIGKGTIIGKIDVEWPGSIEIGSDCTIQNNTTFWIKSPFKRDNRIFIGNNVFVGRNTEFNCCNHIQIGHNCLIASFTVFVDSSHTFFEGGLIADQPIQLKRIILEEDVWIGTGCKILSGVHLGRGCVVGAGAVVNKSIPAYEIWAGVPARKIGERKQTTPV